MKILRFDSIFFQTFYQTTLQAECFEKVVSEKNLPACQQSSAALVTGNIFLPKIGHK